MNKQELKVLAARLGFDLGTLEKDYAITALLPVILPEEEEPMVVFKGGTALNRIHLGYRRLSVDLDFTTLGLEVGEVEGVFKERVTATPSHLDFEFTDVRKETLGGLRVMYLGPLEHRYSIRLEVSTRELPMMEPEWREVTHVYGDDVGEVRALAMPLDEMVSEKLRASMNPRRAKPRDIIDLVNVEAVDPGILKRVWGMARLKCESIGQGFGVDLISAKRKGYESRWEGDLVTLLRGRSPPDFNDTFDGLLALLRRLEEGGD